MGLPDLLARVEGAAELRLHHDGLSRPLENPRLRVLSLGAGVQSSVLALMAARGDLPRLDAAIFADTGHERRTTYAWVDWLETQLPYPLIRVQRPGATLGEAMNQVASGVRPYEGSSVVPLFLGDPDGVLPKQCNADYKRDVVTREIARMLGGAPRNGVPAVEMWMGMSSEPRELQRVGRNRRKYIHNRYPLIEARMKRADCKRWMAERQYPAAPKSACIFCPYRDNEEWLDMQETDPEDFATAVEFDRAWRNITPSGIGGAYVHRQRVPLDQIDFSKDEDPNGLFGFSNDCEGMCGV